MICLRFMVLLLTLGYALTAATAASAQAVEYSCKSFFVSVYQATDCVEALFSEDIPHVNGHLVMGSVPPGNGFALGAVIEKKTHFVSPFAPPVTPDMRDSNPFPPPKDPDTGDKTDQGGYKSLFIPKLGAAFSTNGSWIHLEGTHRVARTVNFYGLSPRAPDVQHMFRFDETYGGVTARLPLVDAFILSGEIEGRCPDLPTDSGTQSIIANFPPAASPGLTAQPTYVHSYVGFIAKTRHLFEATIQGDHVTSVRRISSASSRFLCTAMIIQSLTVAVSSAAGGCCLARG